ncbi:hypothetical protein KBC54_03670 [Patescibacteria group bacterium]|nr:hypothetical protein [Patescibacteria group bacterium]
MTRKILSPERRSTKRRRFSRPSWLWRWHHLISVFVLFVGIGMGLASLQFAPTNQRAHASALENVMGWAWADSIGWISLNSDNVGACNPGPCGSYGVNLDPVSRQINGFAWSDHTGWICFGTSCAAVLDCNGTPPDGLPVSAKLDMGNGSVAAHGWAKVCAEKDDGWISLNCAEAGPGVCATVAPYYHVVFNPSTGAFKDPLDAGSSFAWNGTGQQTGLGYIDFQYAYIGAEKDLATCSDGKDNDVNGLMDCQDPQCAAFPACIALQCVTIADCSKPVCQSLPLCKEDVANPNGPTCADGIDNDNNALTDCEEPACQSSPMCVEDAANQNLNQKNNLPVCGDGIDDDGVGGIDCADPKCANFAACKFVGEAATIPGDPDKSCSNGVDDDGKDGKDCADPACSNVPVCTSSWIQAKFGDVYAKAGISAQGTKSSGTYCLSSTGQISGISSGSKCTETAAPSLSLPSSETKYQGTLGALDIPGIISGRYGKVDKNGIIPASLGGKVYHVKGNYTLNPIIFQNGSIETERGNGLLFVDGGDLTISGNLSYASPNLSRYLRNLASFGVIVTKDSNGNGGNILIQPGVTSIVGAYFAEGMIDTGTLGANDQPLQILGLMAAHQFKLERKSLDPLKASETVIFDGRAVANPPPGMQSVSQSLPTSKNAF